MRGTRGGGAPAALAARTVCTVFVNFSKALPSSRRRRAALRGGNTGMEALRAASSPIASAYGLGHTPSSAPSDWQQYSRSPLLSTPMASNASSVMTAI